MRIGIILKKWRLINELSTAQLSKEIGISVATLNRIENGETVTGETLLKLINWLCATDGGTNNE